MVKLTFIYVFIATFSFQDIWCKRRSYREGGKIVGGNETTIQQYPYQAYLLLYDGRDYYQCGGSIVTSQRIVTAAHCLSRIQKIYVRIGSTESSSGGTQYETTSFSSHPLYNPSTSDYDVGIVRLPRAMNLDGTNARAITIVRMGYDPTDGEIMKLSGWGATAQNGSTSATLREVEVPVVSRTRCNQQLGGGVTSRMFCAGLTEGGKDTCQGDSGGPAVVSTDGRLAGITSFGYGCAQPNSPGVYTRIGNTAIRMFITLNTGLL